MALNQAMKTTLKNLLFASIFLISTASYAQEIYTISGSVTDEKGEPLKAATVFLSGFKKITITDAQGKFRLPKVSRGTYQLAVNMLGFFPGTQNVMIRDSSVEVKVALKIKTVALEAVTIGNDKKRKEYYKLFKKNFLGVSANAAQCEVLNPDIINFSFNKKQGVLKADTDEFLIIENKRLGYRIRYLLKAFEHNEKLNRTNYDGETSFEELEGTNEMKKKWIENRQAAYKGSIMHFLRSVGAESTLKEGFLAHQLYQVIYTVEMDGSTTAMLTIGESPVELGSIISARDTSFISMKFKGLYIDFDPEKAAQVDPASYVDKRKAVTLKGKASLLKLNLEEAIVDRKGNCSDYRTFFIQGDWAGRRIGDQLPYEYEPPVQGI